MKWQKLINGTILGGFLLASALVLPASAQTTGVLQDDVPGSFLVFPIFDISSGHTTQIRICDKSNGPKGSTTSSSAATTATWVRLNFVCPGSLTVGFPDPFCDEYDTDFFLTSHQCKVIDVASQSPPCAQGFIVAFAENAIFQPWAHDHLIGSYHITTTDDATPPTVLSSQADKAIAIQSPQPFHTLLGRPGSLGSDELSFANVAAASVITPPVGTQGTAFPDYVGLPLLLHSDFKAIGAPTGTTDTLLTLLTLNINSGRDNNTTSVKLAWWDETENPNSASHRFVCWDRVSLDSIDTHFRVTGLTTTYGSLRITPSPSNCEFPNGQCGSPAGPGGVPPAGQFFYTPAVLGALEEIGPFPGQLGASLRHLYHTGSASVQTYGPE